MLNKLKKKNLNEYLHLGFFAFAVIHFFLFIYRFIFETILNYKYPSIFLAFYLFVYVLLPYLSGYGIGKKRTWGYPIGLFTSLLLFWIEIQFLNNLLNMPFLPQFFLCLNVTLSGIAILIISAYSLINNLNFIYNLKNSKFTTNTFIALWYLVSTIVEIIVLVFSNDLIKQYTQHIRNNEEIRLVVLMIWAIMIVIVFIKLFIIRGILENKKWAWVIVVVSSLLPFLLIIRNSKSFFSLGILYFLWRLIYYVMDGLILYLSFPKVLSFLKKEHNTPTQAA
ncbi:hypothetical protein A2382_01605 [Candidatus Woesebacteria bacterium RIFOXYB1_FULL_38_16]|uniref:Uncharacterized protein n=1 Tax=Candidatus Woesebacteria bacterium RIFOXYB1_FULL_38_16 TaxID=1802538 RepID=A0A1F8CUW9_9BACT|nr:MAG: hypothetical protein A2191_03185 [Candidatus Woesebacteria bacterium RIFOXYA1_FULL_38_9]OGM80120.1 MAG: hypothetical protein A2382_01605 [Candidatus Woesebacteria bacterium RIFOXYB1_FULL_38_16]